MKEEAGMKRRSPTRALVGLAAAGLVALFGSTAVAQENIYKNDTGIGFGAGPTLNPGGSGQLLYAGYYDVRDVDGDAQHNNIQILNTNTNDTNRPWCDDEHYDRGVAGESCYDPEGGILAKVRFREAIDSNEVLDFVVPLSCGEVWAGNIKLNEGGIPRIKSSYPVYDAVETFPNEAVEIKTSRLFENGRAFVGAAGVSVADMSRGYIEVFAMEALNCEPDSGALSPDGKDTWTRIGFGASNSLSGEVFQVRAAAGVSHAYNMDAITRFVTDGSSIAPGDLLGAEEPDATSCSVPGLTPDDCLASVSAALSKSQLIAQYDIETITNGSAHLVITLPNKQEYCTVPNVPNPPFQCANAGEDIRVNIYDRLEQFNVPETEVCSVSPCPDITETPELLPYEVNIVSIQKPVGEDCDPSGNADKAWCPNSDLTQESGWVAVDLTEDYAGALVHQENNRNVTILGVPTNGYRGLPAIGLVLQEFTNEGTAAGSTYGNTVPAVSSTQIFAPGES